MTDDTLLPEYQAWLQDEREKNGDDELLWRLKNAPPNGLKPKAQRASRFEVDTGLPYCWERPWLDQMECQRQLELAGFSLSEIAKLSWPEGYSAIHETVKRKLSRLNAGDTESNNDDREERTHYGQIADKLEEKTDSAEKGNRCWNELCVSLKNAWFKAMRDRGEKIRRVTFIREYVDNHQASTKWQGQSIPGLDKRFQSNPDMWKSEYERILESLKTRTR